MLEGRKLFDIRKEPSRRTARYSGSRPKKWKMDHLVSTTNLSLNERFTVFSPTNNNCRPLNNKQLLLQLSKEFVCGKAFSTGRLRLAGSSALDNWRLLKILSLYEEGRTKIRRRGDTNVGTVSGLE